MGAISSPFENPCPGEVANLPPACYDLPPLGFHSIHSKNVIIGTNGRRACRFEGFSSGVIIGNRPANLNEQVYLRFFSETSMRRGSLRFGFTSNDPDKIQSVLPKFPFLALTKETGYCVHKLEETFDIQNDILFYYATLYGDVFYGVNGKVKGIFVDKVDVKVPLWVILDITRDTIAVEFVDPASPLTNKKHFESKTSRPRISDLLFETLDLANKNVNDVCFHKLHGRNVDLCENRNLAKKNRTEFSQGYVFTSRSLRPGEVLVVEFKVEDRAYAKELAFGLTNCDPGKLTMADLPNDSEALVDRREYWIVRKDVVKNTRPGESLYFWFLPSGEVQTSKNLVEYDTLMYVDPTQELWTFFDMYGKKDKLRIKGILPQSSLRSLYVDISPLAAGNIAQTEKTAISTKDQPKKKCVKEEKVKLGECLVCFENEINSVIYACGHMCMCMACAKAQKKRQNSEPSSSFGNCPVCRQPIKDIIRIYP